MIHQSLIFRKHLQDFGTFKLSDINLLLIISLFGKGMHFRWIYIHFYCILNIQSIFHACKNFFVCNGFFLVFIYFLNWKLFNIKLFPCWKILQIILKFNFFSLIFYLKNFYFYVVVHQFNFAMPLHKMMMKIFTWDILYQIILLSLILKLFGKKKCAHQ